VVDADEKEEADSKFYDSDREDGDDDIFDCQFYIDMIT
jgi:hypothetical protein